MKAFIGITAGALAGFFMPMPAAAGKEESRLDGEAMAHWRGVIDTSRSPHVEEKLAEATIWKDASGRTVVNDTHPAIRYGPGLQAKVIEGCHHRFTQTKGSDFEYTFIGTDIVWVGARCPWRGYAEVHIDGKKVAGVNPYSPTPEWGVELFRKDGMAHAEHTIRIVCTAR